MDGSPALDELLSTERIALEQIPVNADRLPDELDPEQRRRAVLYIRHIVHLSVSSRLGSEVCRQDSNKLIERFRDLHRTFATKGRRFAFLTAMSRL